MSASKGCENSTRTSESCATTMRQLNIITADATLAQKLKYYEEHFQRAYQSLGFRGHSLPRLP
ncbi:hypothetical protein PHBOTO_002034 [Pseudozyma hubeiensis]|nr:hypothetical protein PHBOTO_002034 [Pseudozyma hubeiensis]